MFEDIDCSLYGYVHGKLSNISTINTLAVLSHTSNIREASISKLHDFHSL